LRSGCDHSNISGRSTIYKEKEGAFRLPTISCRRRAIFRELELLRWNSTRRTIRLVPKRAGEGGIISVGGVIANAVAAALGSLAVQPGELPLSPPRVWQLIKDAAV
jgi:hypothetical protein